MRRYRKRIAGWVILGWLFAQMVTLAHACPALTQGAPGARAASTGAPMLADCDNMAGKSPSDTNVCKAHCTGGPQLSTDVPAPLPGLASQTPLTVRNCVAEPASTASVNARPSRSGEPPPLLLFNRLLI